MTTIISFECNGNAISGHVSLHVSASYADGAGGHVEYLLL
jgi:hypothetical protein